MQHRSAMSYERSGGHGHIKFRNADTKNERAVSQSLKPFKTIKNESSAPRRNKKHQSNKSHNFDAAPRVEKAADSGKKLDVEEIDVGAALEKVAVVPIDHRSCRRASEKGGGKIDRQQMNFNRRLIVVEEEDKEQPDDQAVDLNHNDSELHWNGNIKINHPINNEDTTPAASQRKNFS